MYTVYTEWIWSMDEWERCEIEKINKVHAKEQGM